MVVKINQWYGRLGNNIMQIRNALKIAKDNNTQFDSIKHPFLNIKPISFGDNIFNKSDRFFYDDEYSPEIYKLIRQFIPKLNIDSLKPNTVVIHIRSGDIFSQNPHPSYVPSPFCFYTEIIESNYKNWDIILVTEPDFKNPTVKALKEIYPKLIIQSSTLLNDFTVIYKATDVIFGIGSFAREIVLLSENVKNVHTFRNYVKNTNINWKNYDCKNYINHWKNIPEQLKLIMDINSENLFLNSVEPFKVLKQ